ncbi:MAG: NAD(P)/FAD-dependent oxidoreductase [Hyphomicrobium sp.]|jgi:NADPH-dependent 2,4-dienoyl-CoA reductase/sulfur reductase-like enzyme
MAISRDAMNRRQFGAGLAASVSLAGPALAQGAANIVIIGGGPGGATVAGSLLRADPSLKVTIVEPNKLYTSCFFSNHYIGGFRSIASLTHNYDGLRRLGAKLASDRAIDVDQGKKIVRLEDGRQLSYDVLVVAPGIDFKFGAIEGYDEKASLRMPHAWRGGWQSQALRGRLEAMPDGGLVVIAPPRNPYRCPPGPYERACVIANYLKTKKPKSKLVILDPKLSFSKQPVFEEAFRKYYKDIVELHLTNDIDDMSVVKVDAVSGEVVTKSGERYMAAVANIIPDQRAGDIARVAGLTEGDWCPVRLETFKSAKAEAIYVLGDAAISAEMPKSAFTANNQAKAVVQSILADLKGVSSPSAHYRNTCWSLLAPDDSVKIGADYAPGENKGKRVLVPSGAFVSQPGEKPELRREVYEESLAWYETLVADVFAKDPRSTKAQRGDGKG